MNFLSRMAYLMELFGYMGMRIVMTPPQACRRDLAKRRENFYRVQKARQYKKQPQRRGIRGK